MQVKHRRSPTFIGAVFRRILSTGDFILGDPHPVIHLGSFSSCKFMFVMHNCVDAGCALRR